MRHPTLRTLQDYFESELNSLEAKLVKEHLLECEQCSSMLSQMAKVDTRFKVEHEMRPGVEIQNRIFADAKALLKAKREKIDACQAESESKRERRQALKDNFEEFLQEIKVPALQLATLSLVIGVILAHERTEQVTVKKPLSEEVVVYTHDEGDLE